MYKILIYVLAFLSIGVNSSNKKVKTEGELLYIQKWFTAWEMMSQKVLKLSKQEPPLMLFFDNNYIYTTSEISAPNGELVDGPLFLGQKLPWRKAKHNGTLTLPDGTKVPVGLMTFAAPSGKQGVEAFFVMAAPSFWEQANVDDANAGLEKMLTGIFLHEFAHTRQMIGFGKKINYIESHNNFRFEMSDNIVQDYFKNNEDYVQLYNEEVRLFYKAVEAKNKNEVFAYTKQGMALLKKRQEKYLAAEHIALVELDNLYLSMEGLGQYMITSWLSNPKGGNIPFDAAVQTARRGKNWWSQDEGLALFLILDRLTKPNWNKDIFGSSPKTIIELLEKEVKKQ